MTEPVSTSPKVTTAQSVPVLPLRDVVVYPHMVIPLFVGREKSIQALDVAMHGDKRIMLIAQKQADVDDPKVEDLYRIGTIATILQLLKLPDGTVKVLVEASTARASTSWRPAITTAPMSPCRPTARPTTSARWTCSAAR